jgi:WhiB family redox-sensing transcriptional regulator
VTILQLVPTGDWRDDALCQQVDPELFYPEKGGTAEPAKSICRSCDVRPECLEYALSLGEAFGVWGGMSEKDRRAEMKRRSGKVTAVAA